MLQNRVYRGEIAHKGQSHPGEHPPIIDQPLWNAVQAQLAGNGRRAQLRRTQSQAKPARGIAVRRQRPRMSPSHAVKKETRYRYYVSQHLITKDQTETWRQIEQGLRSRS